MSGEVVLPHPAVDVVAASDVPALMGLIRPQWQAKGLIERVRRLLPVDPSSACQRLLNAAVADLRDKIKIAGLDIAKGAAAAHRLPPVERADDVDNYSTAKLIDLSYRMGLLTRPEWRRLTRAYDIRRDLEHEDSEYEAGVEDCIYIFKTCIEAVLAKDPVNLIRVAEIKEVVEAAGPAVADLQLVEDYEHAPETRQLEILKFLVSTSLNDSEPELVRQNALRCCARLPSRRATPSGSCSPSTCRTAWDASRSRIPSCESRTGRGCCPTSARPSDCRTSGRTTSGCSASVTTGRATHHMAHCCVLSRSTEGWRRSLTTSSR